MGSPGPVVLKQALKPESFGFLEAEGLQKARISYVIAF